MAATRPQGMTGPRKHAFAPRAFSRSQNWPSAHHVSARRRAFCPSRRLRHASDISVAGDDPVNEVDPTGLITIGECVEGHLSLFKSWGGNGCVERLLTNSDDLGGHIAGIASKASALGLTYGASVGAYYDVSSATSLSELGGPFTFAEVGIAVGPGTFGVVYWNNVFSPSNPHGIGSVFGAELGVSFGADVDWGEYGHSDTAVWQPGFWGSLPLWAIWYANPPNTAQLVGDLIGAVLVAAIKAYGDQPAGGQSKRGALQESC
jgi:hypothetical protein